MLARSRIARLRALIGGALLLAGALWVAWQGALAAERPDFARAVIGVERADGEIVSFKVEIASSPSQWAHGLMHVREMGERLGMLFVFPSERPRSFWMKDTFIPLDMLFFDADGGLVSAIENVPPLSLASRKSEGPAKYVLEVNGGIMQRFGLDRGARLLLPDDLKDS